MAKRPAKKKAPTVKSGAKAAAKQVATPKAKQTAKPTPKRAAAPAARAKTAARPSTPASRRAERPASPARAARPAPSASSAKSRPTPTTTSATTTKSTSGHAHVAGKKSPAAAPVVGKKSPAPAPVQLIAAKTSKATKGAIAPAVAHAATTGSAPTTLDRKASNQKQKVVKPTAAPPVPVKPEIKAGPGRIIATPAPRPAGSKPIVVTPVIKKKSKRDKLAAKALNNVPPPPPPPSPVTTDGKPRKNLAGWSLKDLENFRSLLLAKRRELVGDMTSMEGEALRSTTGTNLSNLPLHMADMGTDNYEQEFTLGLVEKDRQLLREINRALAKIQDGSYGICEGTGKPISKPRLEAQPWAKYSIEHARALERNMLRR